MTDDPIIDAEQERSMWQRLASSPYITEEERIAFTLRAHSVANTSGESGRRLSAAIERERERRRSGVPTVPTLPPHAPQVRLDREEQESLSMPLPPGLCVSHSVNATAPVAQAQQLTSSGTYSAAASILPQFAARAVYWDRQPWGIRPAHGWAQKEPNVNELARLLGQMFSGGVTAISLSQTADSSLAELNVKISFPADMLYDDVMANMQRLAGEHSNTKPTTNTGRRRLLKLEKEAS